MKRIFKKNFIKGISMAMAVMLLATSVPVDVFATEYVVDSEVQKIAETDDLETVNSTAENIDFDLNEEENQISEVPQNTEQELIIQNGVDTNDADINGVDINDADINGADINDAAINDAAGAHVSGDWTYDVLSDGTVEIASYKGNAANLTIPAKLDGYTVSKIGSSAFIYNSYITKVSFASGCQINQIEDSAFRGCSELKEITIPDSVTSIGANAFHDCYYLSSVKLSNNIDRINDYTFYYCSSLTQITIPEGVDSIGEYAFYQSGLASIEIPGSVTDIKRWAFGNNYQSTLKSVVLHEGLKNIGEYAFYGNGVTALTIPSTVQTIENYAFSNSKSLETLKLSENLKTLGRFSFSGCTSLTSVEIPGSLSVIGNKAFNACTNLTDVKINEGVQEIEYGAFSATNIKSIVLPKSLTKLGATYQGYEGVFNSCENLQIVVLQGNLSYIGYHTFSYCSRLRSIQIPEKVTNIYSLAFIGCDSLANVYYMSSQDKWKTVSIGDDNESLKNANIHYDSSGISDGSIHTSKDFEYIVLDDGTIEITSYIGNANSITIPAKLDGYSVSVLGNECFKNNYSIATVNFESGSQIKRIGEYAFYQCGGLKEITIPDSVTSIGKYAFYGCNELSKIKLSKNLERINDYTFYNCSSLTQVTIPDSVESIGEYAFRDSGLTSIEIPGSVREIKTYAFGNDYQTTLKSIVLHEGLESIGKYAFYRSGVTTLTIPSTVQTIGEYAFANSGSLKSLKLSENLKALEGYSFSRCTSLTSVEIPGSLSAIGYKAFYACTELTDVNINEGVQEIEYGAFSNTGIKSVVLPKSIIKLGATYQGYEGVFNNCENLQIIVLQGNTSYIGYHTFSYCSKLRSIQIPEKVTNIHSLAFVGCDSLADVYYMSSQDKWKMVSIGEDNESLKNAKIHYNSSGVPDSSVHTSKDFEYIVLDDGTIEITNYVGNANSITIPAKLDGYTVSVLGNECFKNNYSIATVNFESGSQIRRIGEYAFYQCGGLKEITLPDSVTSIGKYAFYGCYELSKVKLSKKLERINDYTFFNCSSLTQVTIPDSVESIGEYAFRESGLTSIDIPGSVKDIKTYAFGDDYHATLKSVVLHEGLESIDNYAFCRSGVTTLTIPSTVQTIGEFAFSYSKSLKTVKLSENLKSLGAYAFGTCTSLASVEIPGSLSAIGEHAFYQCNNLTDVKINEGVQVINYGAFSNTGIKSIVLPKSLTKLGTEIQGSRGVFYGCENLQSVVMQGNPSYIGYNTFRYCKNLKNIRIPGTVTNIYSYAFEGCDSLTDVYYMSNQDKWKQISVGDSNESLNNAEIHYMGGVSQTVYFDPNGGTVNTTSMTVVNGNKYGTLPVPEKNGYVFVGWFTDKVGGAEITSDSTVSLIENERLYAHWEGFKYTVSFESEDIVVGEKKVTYDQPYGELPAPEKYGYTLIGWFTAKVDGTQVDSKTIVNTGKNHTLYARWKGNDVKVTLDANGGIAPEFINVEYDSYYDSLPTPALVGGTFIGWFTQKTGGTLVGAETKVNTLDAHKLYARYELKYTVENPVISFSEPEIADNPCVYYKGTGLSISSATNGAKIYYTLNGKTPDISNVNEEESYTFLFEDNIILTDPVTIKAIAIKPGLIDSEVVSFNVNVLDESTDWGEIVVDAERGIDDRNGFVDSEGNPSADAVPAELWVRGVKDYDFTGKAITQTDIRVYHGKKLLELNKDYTVKYTNNTKACRPGDKNLAAIVITGKGDYSGTITENFLINPLDISAAMVADENIVVAFNKNVQKKTTKVTYELGDKLVTLGGSDFTYVYPHTDNKITSGENAYDPNAFKAANTEENPYYEIHLVGKGNYTGERIVKETITDFTLMSTVTVSSIPNQPYTGSKITPVPSSVKKGNVPLTLGKDYDLTYENNLVAGKATATLIGKGLYAGKKVMTFNITGRNFGSAQYSKEFTTKLSKGYTWNENATVGSGAILPCEIVDDFGADNILTFKYTEDREQKVDTLKGCLKSTYAGLSDEDKLKYDYTYEYVGEYVKAEDRTKTTSEIGTVKVNFEGVNRYTGKATKQYRINGVNLSTLNISLVEGEAGLNKGAAIYTGSEIRPEVSVSTKAKAATSTTPAVDAVKLTESVDYTLKYEKNINVGTATVTVTGINGYTGVVKKTFKINQYDVLSDANHRITVADIGEVLYQKGGAKPAVTVKDGDKVLELNKDYTVTYSNNTKLFAGPVTDANVRTAPTVKITGKGNYKGVIAKNYTIAKSSIAVDEYGNSPVSITATDITYKNAVNTCKPTIKLIDSDGKALAANTDYNGTITYRYAKDTMVVNMVQEGRVKVAKDVVRMEGDIVDMKNDIIPVGAEITAEISTTIPNKVSNYNGNRTITFRYIAADLSKANVQVQPKEYEGKPVTLTKDEIVVKIGSEELKKTDYEIIGYAKNNAKGTAQVTLRGLGSYGGTKTVNFTIIAKSMNYTVVYNKNFVDATGFMKNAVLPANGKIISNSYKRNGYTFAGWSNKPGKQDIVVGNASILKLEDVKVYGRRITLYAQWTPVVNKITYNANGGKVTPAAEQTTYTIESGLEALPAPTKAGYTFAGWYTTSNFKEESKVTSIPTGWYGNKTLFAKWVK